MSRSLSADQLAHYASNGYVSPVVAFSRAQAAAYRSRLESMEQRDGAIPHDRRRKMHLYLQWVDEIVHHPHILDAVENLIGPDILLYHLTLWMKEPHSEARISWHQDSTYFGLSPAPGRPKPDGHPPWGDRAQREGAWSPAQHVTAWVALSPSDLESGCVQVVPGSHRAGQVRHGVGELAGNMLKTGQEIEVPADASIDTLTLRPGEFSLHHTWLHHNSLPNRSHDRRIGLGISYIPTDCRCISRQRLSAMLVRGTDRHRHFDQEVRPSGDMEAAALSRHADSMARWHRAREQLIAEAHGTKYN